VVVDDAGNSHPQYNYPPTPEDIKKAAASQNEDDKLFMHSRSLRSGVPAWCHEAPGTHGSNLWVQHCGGTGDLGQTEDKARELTYTSHMRRILRIEWNSDGTVKSSLCHNADGSLKDWSNSKSGLLKDECSDPFGRPDSNNPAKFSPWWNKP
jgi:hypothetical protein